MGVSLAGVYDKGVGAIEVNQAVPNTVEQKYSNCQMNHREFGQCTMWLHTVLSLPKWRRECVLNKGSQAVPR